MNKKIVKIKKMMRQFDKYLWNWSIILKQVEPYQFKQFLINRLLLIKG